MQPSLLASTIAARFDAHLRGERIRPTYIEGAPGVGKTQIVGQIARSKGVGYHALHAPLMLNEDFGMPDLSGDGVTFKVPVEKFPFEGNDRFAETGIILVDETPQCNPDQQKIWANLFQARELHGYKLKPGWMIVATGNRVSDRAGANRILSHFSDRFTRYTFDVNTDDWTRWASSNDVRPEVTAFIRWRPDLLAPDFNPQLDKQPTPRAWAEGVSPILDVVAAEALHDTLVGDIGEGAAAEFAGFLRTFRALPDPELVISNPDTAAIPAETDVKFAISGALAHRANAQNWPNIMRYAERMPDEFMVALVRDVTIRHPELENTDTYLNWCRGRGQQALIG